MQDKNVIVFDLDGVIVDSIAVMSDLMRASFPGIDDPTIKNLFKGDIHEEVQKTSFRSRVETEEELALRQAIYTKKKLHTELYPGMKDLLSALAKDNTLVINTYAMSRNCLPLLERNGIRECFDLVVSRDDNPSKMENFKVIAERYGKTLSELLFITDTIGDLREAGKLYIPTIIVTWGYHQREDFDDVLPEHLIGFADTPGHLLELIKAR
jgi:phosphoglycolate phosphatase-like HAD superfamily hydrolase